MRHRPIEYYKYLIYNTKTRIGQGLTTTTEHVLFESTEYLELTDEYPISFFSNPAWFKIHETTKKISLTPEYANRDTDWE